MLRVGYMCVRGDWVTPSRCFDDVTAVPVACQWPASGTSRMPVGWGSLHSLIKERSFF